MLLLLSLKDATYEELVGIFATRTAADWERWAVENRLPIAAVRPPAEAAGGKQKAEG